MRIYVTIKYRRMNKYSCKCVHMLYDKIFLKAILLIQAMYTISLWSYVLYDYKCTYLYIYG